MSLPRVAKPALSSIKDAATRKPDLPFFQVSSRQNHLKELSLRQKFEHETIARIMWSDKNVTAINSQDPLTKRFHPRRVLTYQRYSERKDPLWWNVLSKADISPRVVRAWGINRTRLAIKNALKEKGYDQNGYVLKDVEESKRPEKDFVGSIQLMITMAAVRASWEEVNAQAAAIVQEVLMKVSKSKQPVKAKPQRPRPPTGTTEAPKGKKKQWSKEGSWRPTKI